jgi:hypothetical protein
MQRLHRALVLSCLVLAFVLFAGAAGTFWMERQAHGAWTVDEPERVVSQTAAGQTLQVSFRLTNTSSRQLRVLGSTFC